MYKKIAVLPGDGIGPEVMIEAVNALKTISQVYGHQFEFQEGLIGGAAIDAVGDALPAETVALCKSSDAILFGSVGGPKWENLPPNEQPERKGLLGIRQHFGLFANLRPSFVYPELAAQSVLQPAIVGAGFDLLIVRELTGGIYFGPRGTEELTDGGKKAWDTMLYTTAEIERIGRIAFEAARKRSGRLASVDKANVLDSSVLWREVMTNLAQDYPDVELTHLYVDNAAMQLVKWPRQFDVIVTENMFGDILSDISSVLSGSLGMIPSASLAEGSYGLYEPAGGSAPDIAGQGIANPIAQILSAAMMLKYSFDLTEESAAIERAVQQVLAKGYRTVDIYRGEGDKVGTETMGARIVDRIQKTGINN